MIIAIPSALRIGAKVTGYAYFALLLITPAQSQTMDEKLCIFAAAQKLPSISGISIAASRTKAAAVPEAAKVLAESFGSPTRGAEELQRTFGFFNVVAAEEIRRNEAQGKREEAVKALTAALAQRIGGSMLIEIDVRAAAQTATFTFMCARGQSAGVWALPMGISR